jgi:hypothetical protein
MQFSKLFHVRFPYIGIHLLGPGVLRHSVKLRTSTPGYIVERACREEHWTSPTWWRRLHNSVDLWQLHNVNVLFLQARLGMCRVTTARISVTFERKLCNHTYFNTRWTRIFDKSRIYHPIPSKPFTTLICGKIQHLVSGYSKDFSEGPCVESFLKKVWL